MYIQYYSFNMPVKETLITHALERTYTGEKDPDLIIRVIINNQPSRLSQYLRFFGNLMCH
jgi:hypothetical protein